MVAVPIVPIIYQNTSRIQALLEDQRTLRVLRNHICMAIRQCR